MFQWKSLHCKGRDIARDVARREFLRIVCPKSRSGYRYHSRMPTPAVLTRGLTRRFGSVDAVHDVNLSVEPGRFFGFLGPNGAGKSTTIKMLTGLLAPTSGSVEISGLDMATHSLQAKQAIGVVPEGMALMGRLTGFEYLRFVARMYGLPRATAEERADELLGLMDLGNEPKKLVTDYSHGMQRKLALAAAVIHTPRILFLDEPFEGVDAIAAGTLKAMLLRMTERGVTIFLTTHVLEIVEALCSHVAIIDRGSLVAQGSLEELRAGVAHDSDERFGGERLTLEQIFLRIVGGGRTETRELSWLA